VIAKYNTYHEEKQKKKKRRERNDRRQQIERKRKGREREKEIEKLWKLSTKTTEEKTMSESFTSSFHTLQI
jgi:hypothetical protein